MVVSLENFEEGPTNMLLELVNIFFTPPLYGGSENYLDTAVLAPRKAAAPSADDNLPLANRYRTAAVTPSSRLGWAALLLYPNLGIQFRFIAASIRCFLNGVQTRATYAARVCINRRSRLGSDRFGLRSFLLGLRRLSRLLVRLDDLRGLTRVVHQAELRSRNRAGRLVGLHAFRLGVVAVDDLPGALLGVQLLEREGLVLLGSRPFRLHRLGRHRSRFREVQALVLLAGGAEEDLLLLQHPDTGVDVRELHPVRGILRGLVTDQLVQAVQRDPLVLLDRCQHVTLDQVVIGLAALGGGGDFGDDCVLFHFLRLVWLFAC